MPSIEANLQLIDDSALCILRKKRGKGYGYYDENNEKITDKKLMKRISSLIIPPMWTDVQICKFDDGHIQAIGRDTKGRKQYIYHSVWEKQRQEEKFALMAEFGKALPAFRKKCIEHLKIRGWKREKVMALVCMTLDECGIRIGNANYAKQNNTYGLTTLRRKHMELEDDIMHFSYQGKKGVQREVEIHDDELSKLIKKSAELPGYEIFRYKEDGEFHNVDSHDVNEYIRENMGEQFSSKYFRTWVGCRTAIEVYPDALEMHAESPKKKFSNIVLKLISEVLGNTPTVARSYYVHPKIFQTIEEQKIPKFKDEDYGIYDYKLSAAEKIALKVIKG